MGAEGAVQTGRPLCPCHGAVMDRSRAGWTCAVKRRARQRAAYAADPATANYRRTRHALRARIRAKAARIQEMEKDLAQEV